MKYHTLNMLPRHSPSYTKLFRFKGFWKGKVSQRTSKLQQVKVGGSTHLSTNSSKLPVLGPIERWVRLWDAVNQRSFELQECTLPFWKPLNLNNLVLEDEWPSSMFRVWYFIMNVHFSWAQWNLDLLGLFADSNMAKTKNQNFLLWINANRLCLHVGLEFWTIISFKCSKPIGFSTCKFRCSNL